MALGARAARPAVPRDRRQGREQPEVACAAVLGGRQPREARQRVGDGAGSPLRRDAHRPRSRRARRHQSLPQRVLGLHTDRAVRLVQRRTAVLVQPRPERRAEQHDHHRSRGAIRPRHPILRGRTAARPVLAARAVDDDARLAGVRAGDRAAPVRCAVLGARSSHDLRRGRPSRERAAAERVRPADGRRHDVAGGGQSVVRRCRRPGRRVPIEPGARSAALCEHGRRCEGREEGLSGAADDRARGARRAGRVSRRDGSTWSRRRRRSRS